MSVPTLVHAMRSTSSTGMFCIANCAMPAGISDPSPSRITRGRRCACVAGSAAAVRSASTRSSAFAWSCVTPGASRPITPIAPPSSASYEVPSDRGVHALWLIGYPNPSGMTPITVADVFPSLTADPMTSRRPPKERCHTPYPRTITPGAPGISSESSRPRPRRGGTRAVRNAAAVSSAMWIGSGAALPMMRFRVSSRYAPRPSIVRSSRRHSRKSRTTRGSGAFVSVFCVSIVTIRCPSGSGITGAMSLPVKSYQPAPMPIATASASPPAIVRPGYLRSIRSASL